MRALYQAYLQGLPSPLPELLIQYVDFAVWQDEQMKSGAFESHFSYWHEQLDGLSDLALPTDRPRPPMQSFRGAVQWIKLPESLSRALGLLAQQEGITLYMLLLAAFQVLLHRYTGSEDIPVATPSANRNRPEIEGIVGFFVNTLILRSRCSREMSFRRLARQVRETALNCYTHQELPFDRIVERLRPNRELGRNPLAQVVFGFDSASVASDFGNLSATIRSIDNHTAKFDLFLSLRLKPEGIMGRVEYSTDLFEAATIARMARHLETLLGSIVADPDGSIGRLALLPEQERKQILYDWNRTGSDVAELGLAELFERQVRRTPQAPALWFAGESISYSELDGRANQVARMLRQRGAGEESRIGVCMERSREMVVAVLGILKAGAAYVPLDPAYPKPRLGFMMRDAGLLLTLTQARLKESLPRESGPVLALEEEWAAVAREPETVPPLSAGPDNLAYVIYTSGSTGHPKGVSVPHRAVARLVLNTNYLEIFPSDRVAQLASISFDAATLEIWGALLNGACLVVFSPRASSLDELGSSIEECGVTVLWLTAALFHQMVERQLPRMRGLRLLFTGGEVVLPDHARVCAKALTGCVLRNGYGPTENTTFTATWEIRPDAVHETVPIGHPISNSTVYVLDGDLQPVPTGVAGELYTGGAGLARGYHGHPQLTAERFIPDPLSGIAGSRLYRTGDRVRWRSDGTLEFLGRIDRQVKLRGFRIELSEIEAVARKCPGVADCIVLLREDMPGYKELVAYVVFSGKEQASVERLKEQMSEHLPGFMMPSAFVRLPSMPLTRNGKIDRDSLPAPDRNGAAAFSFVPPKNEIEAALAWIWEKTLLVEDISMDANFFELGGHSLLATELVARISSVFKMKVPLRWLFEKPTIAQFAEILPANEPQPGQVKKIGDLFAKARSNDRAHPPDISRAQPA
jgi:amino acid adenylation domain-containing protein